MVCISGGQTRSGATRCSLKELEDRGLLVWDRSANTYDMHPIIRAFAFDRLGESGRIQANDRIRDHFQSLPFEDPDRATSIEDLTQTIAIFRAMVGANRLDEAGEQWNRFGRKLLVNMGAYSTVAELLSPLATSNNLWIRSDLAAAYYFSGRYKEAISQEVSIIGAHMKNDRLGQCPLRLV